jgi:hypothetical protein
MNERVLMHVRSGRVRQSPFPDWRDRALAAVFVAMVCCAAPTAAAEIFKCATRDGTPLYQNFPCGIDSIGSVATDAPVAATDPKLTKAKASLPADAPRRKPSAATPVEIRVGMSADEVRALLGDPADVLEDEPASGRVSSWRYADGRSVQFDYKNRVTAVQR